MTIAEFTKKKDFLICVDSEGCAIDSMNRKHMKCFGPCLIKEWHLENWNETITERWNEINLYTMTRGIDRFKGLLTVLIDIDDEFTKIDGLSEYEYWVETTIDHSTYSLKAELKRTNSEIFKKVLRWSEASDKAIQSLSSEEIKLFDGVKAALEYAHIYADIAVISTAEPAATAKEHNVHGLLDYVDVVCCENGGTKVSCIQELMKKGYSASHILMVGDASEDMKAAQKNGTFFYPILVKQEAESWEGLVDTALQRFISGEYAGPYQKYMIDRFTKNLTL